MVPSEYVVTLLPLLKPRSYSIASAFDAKPGVVELCVAVVDYKTLRKRHVVVGAIPDVVPHLLFVQPERGGCGDCFNTILSSRCVLSR